MDDSSMGLNKTAMAEGSSDSIALSENSGDVMDLSLLAAPVVAASRKSILPFSLTQTENVTSVQDVRDTFQPGGEFALPSDQGRLGTDGLEPS